MYHIFFFFYDKRDLMRHIHILMHPKYCIRLEFYTFVQVRVSKNEPWHLKNILELEP